jgi:hypothetical protein
MQLGATTPHNYLTHLRIRLAGRSGVEDPHLFTQSDGDLKSGLSRSLAHGAVAGLVAFFARVVSVPTLAVTGVTFSSS